MADNLEYVCKECGFNWITLNGEHHICPKCHSETIEYIGEVNDLDIDSIKPQQKNGRMLRFCSWKRTFDLWKATS